jgi:D-xylose transport system permease protein
MNARALLKSLSMPIALALIVGFFALREPAFLGSRNLTQLIIEFATVGTLALGMFMILLTGQIDLSAGSGVGLIGGISAVLIFNHGWSAPAAMGVGFVAALLFWALMGTLIVKERITSFIITLGGLLIFKGVFWKVIASSTIPVARGDDENLFSLITTQYLSDNVGLGVAAGVSVILAWLVWRARVARKAHALSVASASRDVGVWLAKTAALFALVVVCNGFRGVPLSLLILGLVAVVVFFLTKHTPFGRYLYAIGGNEEAAVLSGIAVQRVMIGAYVLMGVMVAITSFMMTAYTGASTTTVGELMELDAIAACVIGGTALKGGRGTVLGVLFGALIMTALLNGMTLMAVAPEYKLIARGTVLVLAVWLDVRLSRS